MLVRRVTVGLLAGVLLTGAGTVATAAPAAAAAGGVVSTDPSDVTPRVVSGTAVHALRQLGGTMYAGGSFRQVSDARGGGTVTRENLMAFDAVSGALRPFSVTLPGTVWAIATDGTSLYVGGQFGSVNGVSRRALVKLDPVTGAVDPTFNARLTGRVYDLAVVRGRLLVGGSTAKRLQALDLRTGADTGYVDLGISGGRTRSWSGPTQVYRFAVSPDSSQLVITGTFDKVGGAVRRQVAKIDLGPSAARVSSWYAPVWNSVCNLPAYANDVAFSPDGSMFVVVTTGGGFPGDTTRVCDAASSWSAASTSSRSQPRWVNYTGGDTLHSVAVSNGAVYVQGHQRWLNNPYGRNSAGPGAVARPGIGAIHPDTGRALAWNPTKTRGVGGRELLLTGQGLWVGSDTNKIGREVHEKLALLPS